MAIGTYISIINLSVNGLHAPTKRHRLVYGYKNKIHIYVVYKSPASHIKTHLDWKWDDGRRYGSDTKVGVVILKQTKQT